MRKIGVFLLSIATILSSACVDEIALDVPQGEIGKLAIEGRLTLGDPSFAYVVLNRTSDFSVDSFPERVDGATVIIHGENGGGLQLLPVGFGRYEAEAGGGAGLEVVAGTAYRLEIVTPEAQIYTSTWETLYPVPKAESLEFAVITKEIVNSGGNLVEDHFVEFAITTPVIPPGASEPARLIWNFEGCYQLSESAPSGGGIPVFNTCYITQNLNLDKVIIFDGSSLDGNKLTAFPLLDQLINTRFSKGFYLTAYQRSLSPGAFEYWSQVRQVVERDGGLFEPPPGPVRSNLSNANDPDEQVLGYFSAEAVDTVRVKVSLSSDIRPVALCNLPDAINFPFCQNCLLWPGSTLEQPDYWVD